MDIRQALARVAVIQMVATRRAVQLVGLKDFHRDSEVAVSAKAATGSVEPVSVKATVQPEVLEAVTK